MSGALVYCHLQHDIPRCFWSSLQKVRESWDGPVYYIGPRRELRYYALDRNSVNFICEDEFYKDDMIKEYEAQTYFNNVHVGWDGFWDNACKRFIYLYLFMLRYGVDEILHIETDVIPYMPLSVLFESFGHLYNNKIVFSDHAPYQYSCCTVYCNGIDAIKKFCKKIIAYFKDGPQWFYTNYPEKIVTIVNETHFAYRFATDHKHITSLFPTMPDDLLNQDINFLIDPTAWGMWVGGLHHDPGVQFAAEGHHIGKEILAGKYDVHFSYEHGKIKVPYIYNKINGLSYPLATLHFNSKRPETWI